MSFPEESIPDESRLFYRIHEIYIDPDQTDPKKRIKPGAFDPQPKPDGTEMSVDWDKYATAMDTRNRARKPEKNGVVSFVAGQVRQSPTPLHVSHKPTANKAHAIIWNVLPHSNHPEIRIKLRRICQWEIPLTPP